MATDSVMGLFADPQQIQQQQYQQVLDRNIRLAQLDPFERANAMIGTGAYQLAGAIGGALGAQDPQLARATQRRAFIQQVNMADPKSLVQAIQASANDPEMSAFLMGKYKELTGIQKDQSVITKNENWQAAQADVTQKRNLVAEVEDKLSRGESVDQVTINKAKLAFGDISRPKTFQQADGTIVTVPPTVDTSMFPNIGKFMSSVGGTGGGKAGVITTPLSEEKASQAEEARRGRLNSLEAGSAQLQTTLDTITQTKGLIGNKTTGYGAYLAGLPTSDAMTLSDNTEQIKASVALTKLKEMKQESKTGASGLGALNMKELETIQSILGKLNPKSANYANDLKKVEDFFVRAQKAMDEEIKLTRGKVQQQSNSPDVAPKQSPMAGRNPQIQPLTFEQKVQRTMSQPQNKGKSRSEIEAALRAAGHN